MPPKKKPDKKRLDPESEGMLSAAKADIKAGELAASGQEKKEHLIAEVYQMIGRVQAMDVVRKFADVSNLVWLKQVKESKAYKEVPDICTWDKFCKSIGLDTKTVDENLRNLQTFGEEFLLTVSSLGLGYRDLRKLRRLEHDGAVAIEDGVIIIGGAEVPFGPEYKEELQAAIEGVLEEKDAEVHARDRTLKSKEDVIKKLDHALAKYEREAKKKDLTPEDDAYLQQAEHVRTGFDGYMLSVEALGSELGDDPSPRQVAAYIETLTYMYRQVRAHYDTATDTFGPTDELPELG